MNPILSSSDAEPPASFSRSKAGRHIFLPGWPSLGLILGVAAIVALALLFYFYRPFLLSGLDIIAEVTGSRSTALAAVGFSLLLLVWLCVWMLFPIFVYLGLRDLRRRTAQLDQNTRLCAHRLSQLLEERREWRSSRPPGSQPPNALRER